MVGLESAIGRHLTCFFWGICFGQKTRTVVFQFFFFFGGLRCARWSSDSHFWKYFWTIHFSVGGRNSMQSWRTSETCSNPSFFVGPEARNPGPCSWIVQDHRMGPAFASEFCTCVWFWTFFSCYWQNERHIFSDFQFWFRFSVSDGLMVMARFVVRQILLEGYLDKVCHQVSEEVFVFLFYFGSEFLWTSQNTILLEFKWREMGGQHVDHDDWLRSRPRASPRVPVRFAWRSARWWCRERKLQKLPTRIATQFLTWFRIPVSHQTQSVRAFVSADHQYLQHKFWSVVEPSRVRQGVSSTPPIRASYFHDVNPLLANTIYEHTFPKVTDVIYGEENQGDGDRCGNDRGHHQTYETEDSHQVQEFCWHCVKVTNSKQMWRGVFFFEFFFW